MVGRARSHSTSMLRYRRNSIGVGGSGWRNRRKCEENNKQQNIRNGIRNVLAGMCQEKCQLPEIRCRYLGVNQGRQTMHSDPTKVISSSTNPYVSASMYPCGLDDSSQGITSTYTDTKVPQQYRAFRLQPYASPSFQLSHFHCFLVYPSLSSSFPPARLTQYLTYHGRER